MIFIFPITGSGFKFPLFALTIPITTNAIITIAHAQYNKDEINHNLHDIDVIIAAKIATAI